MRRARSPLLVLPKSWQELPIAGGLKSERLVGTLRIAIVFQHPEHEVGYAHSTIKFRQGVQQCA